MSGLKLRPYQDEAADFLYERDRAMILAPVGAGKTAITLTAMDDFIDAGVVQRFLVLAPKRVCTDVWPVEAPKWTTLLRVGVAIGSAKERQRVLDDWSYNVVVINYDNIGWLTEQDLSTFDAIVFDELTKLKNPSGTRFKALHKVIDQFKIRWGLTGSFTSNGLEDVFGQCKIIDEKLLGRAKGAFLQQYFVCMNRDFGEWIPRPGALPLVMERIKPATYVLEPGEYRDKLPPCHVVELRCTLNDRLPYEKMKKDFVVQFPTAEVLAANAAAVTSKLQQMACLAHGTEVLTEHGWRPIEQITNERVWDGIDWVTHDGCIFKGVQPIYACYSVFMTYNHKVLTVAGWKTAKEIGYGNARQRFDRHEVWLPDGFAPEREKRFQLRALVVRLRLWARSNANKSILTRLNAKAAQLRMQTQQHGSRHDWHSTVSYLVKHAQSMFNSYGQRLQKLWRARHYGVQNVARQFFYVLARHATWIRRSFNVGTYRQQWAVQQNQLPVGYGGRTGNQPTWEHVYRRARGSSDDIASGAQSRNANPDFVCPSLPIQMDVGARAQYARTYDLVNCGPRNRFVVRGYDSQALIVHNCGFVYDSSRVASDAPGKFTTSKDAVWFSRHKFERLDELLEENQHANTLLVYQFQEEVAELRRRYPKLATLDDPDAIKRWNAGQIELLAVHPKSAGHGLNLQHGGCHMVFLSLPWSLELYEQTVGRLHRSGQQRDVWVYILLAEKTVDEKIFAALHDKRAISDIAMEALK